MSEAGRFKHYKIRPGIFEIRDITEDSVIGYWIAEDEAKYRLHDAHRRPLRDPGVCVPDHKRQMYAVVERLAPRLRVVNQE